MTHSHSHVPGDFHTPANIRRLLALITLPFALATLAGLVVLWPEGSTRKAAVDFPSGLADATVTAVEEGPCPGFDTPSKLDEDAASEPAQTCTQGRATLTSGPDRGREAAFDLSEGVSPLPVKEGDKIVLAKDPKAPAGEEYYFADRQRSRPMLLLAAIFAAVVVALGRLKGLSALAGLAVSLGVLVFFVLPAILDGSDPVAVSVVGSALVMFVGLYTAHGFNARTTSALLGTLVSLSITALLAFAFVAMGQLSGFSSEEATFLNVASAGSINFRGLVLAGIVIGSLGVLDDVTVTQASAVWQLRASNPSLTALELYRFAIRIGRDHIASTVNTLVLAYAGASLPLLMLFTLGGSRIGDVVTSEIVAEEILRTLVGSIGLVASVPITTGLAAVIAVKGRPQGRQRPAGAESG
ncbi:MAG: YibE/F family protein [Actinomycetota bacterium]